MPVASMTKVVGSTWLPQAANCLPSLVKQYREGHALLRNEMAYPIFILLDIDGEDFKGLACVTCV